MTIKKTMLTLAMVTLFLVGVAAFAEENQTDASDVKSRPNTPNYNLEKMKLQLQREKEAQAVKQNMLEKRDDRMTGSTTLWKREGENEKNFSRMGSSSPFKRFIERDPIPFKMRLASTTGNRWKEIKEKFKTEKNKMIGDRINFIVDKLSDAVDRLLAIGVKLEDRMDKMQENGVDLSASEELLITFKDKADDAKDAITLANSNIQTILDGEIGEGTGAKVKAELKKAEESVKAAHRALVETIISVKSNIKEKRGNDGHATSTASTTDEIGN